MKKLLGLALLTFLIIGFSGIAKSASISATEFNGYRIEINQDKLNELYSRILQQPRNAPPVYLQEKPSSFRRGGYLAFYGGKKHEIVFCFPNWLSKNFQDRETLEKKVINILAHEISHAIGDTQQPPFLAARIHKWLMEFLKIIYYPLYILLFILISLMVISQNKRLYKISTIFIFLFFGCFIAVFLAICLREYLAELIKNDLLALYMAKFQEIVKVIKL